MPADERDGSPAEDTSQDEGGTTGPGGETPAPPEGGAPATPAAARRRRGLRRIVNRRNAMWAGVVAVVAVVALALVAVFLYRSGRVDEIIARQLINTLAKYNVRAEIEGLETQIGPRTAVITNLKLYNAATGARIAEVDRVTAKVRIEDLWALSLTRDVSLEELTVEGLEAWVVYDERGRSNFAELKLPPPDPNRRILFEYSTAKVELKNSVVHYDDDRYDISGVARNLRALVRPEDPNAPEESRANLIDLWLDDSTFTYNGRAVNNISVEAHARADQVRADINELILRSPVTEARLSGALEDWRSLRYRMRVNASVDLTQTSDVLQLETTMRGAGRFEGVVTGEGDKYRVEGQVVSDALAADGVRLRALNVNATATGQGSSYEAQGRAVAELLTAGDFQLNVVQVAGGVVGTGTDFRWVGDLQAASARSGSAGIAGLILTDAVAELRGGEMSGGAQAVAASSITFEDALLNNVRASGVRFARGEAGATRVTAEGAQAARVAARGATLEGVTASGVEATIAADDSVRASVNGVRVGGVTTAEARTGSINIAGVRLSVSPAGRVEATSGDINVGTVALQNQGRAENVRLARPQFVLEPSGRYRASADLSLGGGVLGQMNLGAARANVVATNDQIRLSDFVAQVFNGRAAGDATISTTPRGASVLSANFQGVDVGGLIAALTGRAVPLTGAATGTADLRFPGTNFGAASGRLEAEFDGATGRDETARTPVTGTLAVNAVNGNFEIERANLRTGQTELTATGRFSLRGDSDLAVRLDSADASELQRVALSTGLLPDIEKQLNDRGVQLAGGLTFDGTVSGPLSDPLVNGRFELGALTAGGRNLGSLSAEIVSNAAETRINNGRLAEPDGGGAQFAAVIPRAGENNVSFEATLDQANAGNLAGALGLGGAVNESLAGLGPASGRINVTGYPGDMAGSANLRVGAGRVGEQPYEEITARLNFNGAEVVLENAEARLAQGRISATGSVALVGKGNIHSPPLLSVNNLRVQGDDVPLSLLTGLSGAGGLPRLEGVADFTATLSGSMLDPATLRAEINAQGQNVTVNGRPAGELTLVGRMTPDQKFNVELTTGLLGQPQVIRAQVDLTGENLPLTVETTLTGADLAPLFEALLPGQNVRVTGRATGSVRLSGGLFDDEGNFTASGLSGRAEFSELGVQVADVPLTAENPLVVLFTPAQVTFERTRFTGPGTNITIGGTAALGSGGTQNLTVNGDLNLRVLSNPQQNFFLSGTARVGVSVKGTFAAPDITGTASVENASLALLVADERLTATGVTGSIRFNSNQASIESLSGRLGGGSFTAAGGALISGFRPTRFRVTVNADNVTVPFPEDFRTTADARLEISGDTRGQFVRGTVDVRRAEYTQDIDLANFLDRRPEVTISEGGGVGGGLGALTLDLSIEGRDALVVRNNLGDLAGSLNLSVRGPADDPVISGRVTSTRGRLNFRNEQFEIQRAIIDLPPRREADPLLNIQTEADIRGYRVRVGITGPLSQPVTTLSSDPSLPQADVVSLITTGELAQGEQSFSTLAQTGLGTATSLLTESLINAPVRKATDRLFGLNRFEFDPVIAGRGGASPTARLTVGRQINRDLAVTYSTNVTGEPNQVLAVQYQVSDRLSFIAQYQQGSTDALRSRGANFSFELRFRKRY
jgi:autotransporter translocation and assembly factor TamB